MLPFEKHPHFFLNPKTTLPPLFPIHFTLVAQVPVEAYRCPEP